MEKLKLKLKINFIQKVFYSFSIIITSSVFLFSQSQTQSRKQFVPTLGRELKSSEIFKPPGIQKKPGHYSKENWQALIDSVWGEGFPTSEKLEIFDYAFDLTDWWYAAYMNLDVNIDSLRNLYRPEIESGVSRGRFAAIMNYFSLAMKECHNVIMDRPVNWGTPILPGIPLLVVGPWWDNARFGACLTPLPDSTLLVYRVLPNHVLSLEPGDVILGYDGFLWKELYKELLEAQLPIHLNWVWGSNDKSITHCILASAGLNWHLFDTIDIVKHLTGDTIHLPTNLLENQSGTIWGNEQLDVPGVDWPNFLANDFVNWGIVEGTQVGYIYVTNWNSSPQYHVSQQFYNAVDSLMHHNETAGIIFDFRLNYGGGGTGPEPPVKAGLELLFNSTIYTIGFDERCDPYNHFDMCSHLFLTPYYFRIVGDPSTYYNKPIAILTGPGAVSAGDIDATRLGFHPKAKFFGKPSSGAFSRGKYPNLGHPDWFFYLTDGSAYLYSNHQYLVHKEIDMEVDVWLTKQGVISGVDDVVEAAIEWINNTSSVEEMNSEVISGYWMGNNYPNPFNPTTTIDYQIPRLSFVTIKVFDVLGNEVAKLVNEEKPIGSYEIEFDATNLPSGIYFYQLQAGSFVETNKMVLMK